MQIECMSSEESDVDEAGTPILRVRGYAWRSGRLQRYYNALDAEDERTSRDKPRRGTGRRPRVLGPPKDGFTLPPKGVARWMVSSRWVQMHQMTHPDLRAYLSTNVKGAEGFHWAAFRVLGDASDGEGDDRHFTQDVDHQHYTSELTSAYQYAFAA